MGREKEVVIVKDCINCYEKKRADYWHQVATFLLTIIGGVVGGVVGTWVIKLLGG